MKGSKIQIVCPGCRTEYQLSQFGVLKLIRRPRCERCGANLLDSLKGRFQPSSTGEQSPATTICPRCRQEQESAQYCKWCGAALSREARSTPTIRSPRSGRPRLEIFAGLALFLILLVGSTVRTLDIPQAYDASVVFFQENQGLRAPLGGRLDWTPIPFFFWKETDGPREAWKGSFYFLVKGPAAATVVCVRLQKAGQSKGPWQIAEGSFYLDSGGGRRLLSPRKNIENPKKPGST